MRYSAKYNAYFNWNRRISDGRECIWLTEPFTSQCSLSAKTRPTLASFAMSTTTITRATKTYYVRRQRRRICWTHCSRSYTASLTDRTRQSLFAETLVCIDWGAQHRIESKQKKCWNAVIFSHFFQCFRVTRTNGKDLYSSIPDQNEHKWCANVSLRQRKKIPA